MNGSHENCLRILVLDDNLESAWGGISKALGAKPSSLLVSLNGMESAPIQLDGISASPVYAKFVCNRSFHSSAQEIANNLGVFNGMAPYDLVLLDDQWQDAEMGGQDHLLGPVYRQICGEAVELPIIALFTQHWHPDRLERFFKRVNEECLDWRRLVPCEKGDKIQLLHILYRILATKGIVHDRDREMRRANDLAARAEVEGISISESQSDVFEYEGMVGGSASMRQVFDVIGRMASTPLNVLIQGESGTGKEEVARALHRKSSRSGPFVAENMGAITYTLAESVLFGHERGAFTGAQKTHHGLFERAKGGTLFLDEIAEMPLELQVKLLRVLDTRKVCRVGGSSYFDVDDVRILAATNQDIDKMVREGRFREDLYYRLVEKVIKLPPLRARKVDIPLLVNHFLKKHSPNTRPSPTVSKSAWIKIKGHEWPGNIRELEKLILAAIHSCNNNQIEAHDIVFVSPGSLINDGEQAVESGECGAKGRFWTFDDFVTRGLVIPKTKGKPSPAYAILKLLMDPPGREVSNAELAGLYPGLSSNDLMTKKKAESAWHSTRCRVRKILEANSECGWMLPDGEMCLRRSCAGKARE